MSLPSRTRALSKEALPGSILERYNVSMGVSKTYPPPEDGTDWPGEAALRLFCQEYIIDFRGVDAVYRANLRQGRKTARALAKDFLTRPFVRKEIQRLLDKSEKDNLVTRSRIMGRLWSEANAEDDLLGPTKAGTRIKALETLAKMEGFFEPEKHEVDITTPVLNISLSSGKKKLGKKR